MMEDLGVVFVCDFGDADFGSVGKDAMFSSNSGFFKIIGMIVAVFE